VLSPRSGLFRGDQREQEVDPWSRERGKLVGSPVSFRVADNPPGVFALMFALVDLAQPGS